MCGSPSEVEASRLVAPPSAVQVSVWNLAYLQLRLALHFIDLVFQPVYLGLKIRDNSDVFCASVHSFRRGAHPLLLAGQLLQFEQHSESV